jgi:hypothetical protein
MILKEEYATTSATLEEQKVKKIISNDAYAVCDFIERLLNKIESMRLSK